MVLFLTSFIGVNFDCLMLGISCSSVRGASELTIVIKCQYLNLLELV